MPIPAKTKPKAPTKTRPGRKISPFKDVEDFEKEITDFANRFKTVVADHSKRISDYFEMCCFNYIVRFYELQGYSLEVKNLKGNAYRYKCSPAGLQENFSNFEAIIGDGKENHRFEIHHNLAIQSSHDQELFTNPDISIINSGRVIVTDQYYDSKKRFSFVKNLDLISFCEAKQFNPFPELLFNFIGVLNELDKNNMIGNTKKFEQQHIAPSLMISGKPNKQTTRIKESLERRYTINIIYDLFDSGMQTFSRHNIANLKTYPLKEIELPF